MAEIEWIKLYLKSFRTSRKISAIERMKNGDTIIVIWFKLLCLAGEINDGGAIYVTSKIPFDSISLADELKKPRAIVETALKALEDHDMIFKDDAGFIQIVNWDKYQNIDGLDKIREQNRKRQKKWYDKQKSNADITPPNVRSNADITLPNDTEEEREEDEEKEISFNLSVSRARNENSGKEEDLKRQYLGGELGGGVVFISNAQFHDLLDWLDIDELEHYMSVIRECEQNGKPFKKKTHYQAIVDMATKDRKIKKNK